MDKQEVAAQVYDQALATAKASTASVAAARANEAAAQQAVQAGAKPPGAIRSQPPIRRNRPAAGFVDARPRPRRASPTWNKNAPRWSRRELNLQYTKIVAPVSGEVNKTVVVGMNVQPGQELLTVVPLEEVWITANFKETQLRQMRVGQKSEIHVDSSGRTFKGHVDSIAGATGPLFSLLPPENATGNYVKIVQRIPVKIVLDPGENQDHQLRPGMNVVPDVYVQ